MEVQWGWIATHIISKAICHIQFETVLGCQLLVMYIANVTLFFLFLFIR